jgi:3-oxoacyl-[acyl-carrier protein] reductase
VTVTESPLPVAGRVALVTGSGRNIGRAVVLGLAAAGANVVVHGRSDMAAAQSVVREAEALGVEALACMADLSEPEQISTMMRDIHGRFGRVDILIHSAGIRRRMPFVELSYQDWREASGVMLDAAFLCIQSALPSMIANQFGRIILISGEGAFLGLPLSAHVAAAKMGLVGLARSLASEFATGGVTANVLTLGVIDTTRDLALYPDPSQVNLERVPMGRYGQPSEVAGLCVFLASEAGAYMTGQTIHLNGGMGYH